MCKESMKCFTLYLSPELMERLEKWCYDRDLSRTTAVREIITEYLDREDRDEKV